MLIVLHWRTKEQIFSVIRVRYCIPIVDSSLKILLVIFRFTNDLQERINFMNRCLAVVTFSLCGLPGRAIRDVTRATFNGKPVADSTIRIRGESRSKVCFTDGRRLGWKGDIMRHSTSLEQKARDFYVALRSPLEIIRNESLLHI
jgi:hypothetical protein